MTTLQRMSCSGTEQAVIIWLMSGIGLQVYLGKWHGSEVAVKCLNPGLFFGGGDANNHAAVNELVKEADMLGR